MAPPLVFRQIYWNQRLSLTNEVGHFLVKQNHLNVGHKSGQRQVLQWCYLSREFVLTWVLRSELENQILAPHILRSKVWPLFKTITNNASKPIANFSCFYSSCSLLKVEKPNSCVSPGFSYWTQSPREMLTSVLELFDPPSHSNRV